MMACILRHAVLRPIEDRWFIHVEPDTKRVISTPKILKRVEFRPEITSAFVEEIDPNTVARPAIAFENLTISLLNKDIAVLFVYPMILLIKSLRIHSIRVISFLMWVCNYYKTPVLLMDFSLHLF